MRNILIETGGFYHVYNRGVDKRTTFLDDEDFLSFTYFIGRSKHDIDTGKHLVNIHAYTLMPNHFHFLIEQASDDGIAQFMQRLGTSYTREFNRKYNRNGCLFASRYNAKHVDTDAYLASVAAYIHRNPLDIAGFETVEALDLYPWSSYPHYRNLAKSPMVDGTMLLDFFGGTEHVQAFHRKNLMIDSGDIEEASNSVSH